ncbi:hypothetical protein [Ruania alba]|uniref:hypothetical protein n=1 Tax=Ruania alba TaxID=648782 RepID=UPI001587C3FC|nr:hypothetical protein [Ruania alba]
MSEPGEARETLISRGTRASVGTLAPVLRRAVRILRFRPTPSGWFRCSRCSARRWSPPR